VIEKALVMPLISTSARYFAEVAHCGSIRRAAVRLNASPSAVNRRILNLEAELGVAVFERLPRGVRPTAAGELLLLKVRGWQRELEGTKRHLQELRGLRRGHAAIGMMECLAHDFGPRVFARIQERNTGLTFAVSVAGTEQLVRDVDAGVIDIAIAFNAPDHANIKRVWSISVPIGVIVSPVHPLSRVQRLTLSELAYHPVVLPDHSLAMRAMIDAAMTREGIEPLPMLTSNSIELIKGAVRHSGYVALLNRIDAHREIASGDLVFRPLADHCFKPEILSVCAEAKRMRSPIVNLVIEELKSAMDAIVA
jgi:DNA-binding transcriptional LysR family regulator